MTCGCSGYITFCIVKDLQCLTVLYSDTLLPLDPLHFLLKSVFSFHFKINP